MVLINVIVLSRSMVSFQLKFSVKTFFQNKSKPRTSGQMTKEHSVAFDKIVSETEGMAPHSTHEWTELLLWQLTAGPLPRACAICLIYIPSCICSGWVIGICTWGAQLREYLLQNACPGSGWHRGHGHRFPEYANGTALRTFITRPQ